MDRETTANLIKIMQAYMDGKEIQFYTGSEWEDILFPAWNFEEVEYRIKPKPAEVWSIYNRNGIRWGTYDSKEAAEVVLNYRNDPYNHYESAPYTMRRFISADD